MALVDICRLGDPILRQKAESVPKVSQKIKDLLTDLTDTMYAAPGVGLAAPQIGVSKRVIVIDVGEGLLQLVNPVLLSQSGNEIATEGCLSIPGIVGDVNRATEVVVRGLNNKGRRIEIRASGFLARALQHEIDHLEGILFIDKATNIREAPGEEDDSKKEEI
ncbi:MAG: peptide deformylase [Firmicutes bacterium]|nr:peptide deformylase [Bacillota bacterium]